MKASRFSGAQKAFIIKRGEDGVSLTQTSTAVLGVLFFEVLFADFITPADVQQYIVAVILLGATPCAAAEFVWSQLTRGDATQTTSDGALRTCSSRTSPGSHTVRLYFGPSTCCRNSSASKGR